MQNPALTTVLLLTAMAMTQGASANDNLGGSLNQDRQVTRIQLSDVSAVTSSSKKHIGPGGVAGTGEDCD